MTHPPDRTPRFSRLHSRLNWPWQNGWVFSLNHLWPSRLNGLTFTAIVLIISLSLIVPSLFAPTLAQTSSSTSEALWSSYLSNPNNNAYLPNNSYAGYHYGEQAIPDRPTVVNLTDFGGTGNGTTDNTAAFRAAIAEAARLGGGAVQIPPGNYSVSGLIHLNQSGVVLRGSDPANTTITFTRPLQTVISPLVDSKSQSRWSWLGGLIWISPADTFNSSGQLLTPTNTIVTGATENEDWERWRFPSGTLARVTSTNRWGNRRIQVDSTANLRPGMFVLMNWQRTSDFSLAKHLSGSTLMATSFPWSAVRRSYINKDYPWPVQIDRIEGQTVFLKQPLRMEVRPEWAVTLRAIGPYIQESGIENLTLKMVGTPEAVSHLKSPGHNGLYFNRAINCWARNIVIENAENGVIVSQAKNVTAQALLINGPAKMHHGTANRFGATDILISDFQINAPVYHGINVENYSPGNVWSKGVMLHGTFDSHRGLPFDAIRTEITIYNDGVPGGASDAGPYNGRRVVHWNVNVINNSKAIYVYQPDAHASSALVGIRGVTPDRTCAWAMICGRKNVVIANEGSASLPPNLYEAQLNLRLTGQTSS